MMKNFRLYKVAKIFLFAIFSFYLLHETSIFSKLSTRPEDGIIRNTSVLADVKSKKIDIIAGISAATIKKF
jgi:hypothetical protein